VDNRINGFWIPACAGMTDFLRFFTFFNTLLMVSAISLEDANTWFPLLPAAFCRTHSYRMSYVRAAHPQAEAGPGGAYNSPLFSTLWTAAWKQNAST
jgi:hypothetical protein